MIALKIGANARDFADIGGVDESWISRQINGLQGDHYPVCVRVTVEEGPINMTLATTDCAASGGGGRPPNAQESQAFELWEKLGLSKRGFSGGNLIAFFKQLRPLVH
jgi:hypothetical protein